jgi:hypothetical protein
MDSTSSAIGVLDDFARSWKPKCRQHYKYVYTFIRRKKELVTVFESPLELKGQLLWLP